jgi:hypothetical protein
MAAADKTRTEWGVVMGGTGTDATVVDSGRLWVKAMGFAGNADNATCSCTTSITDATTAAARLITCALFKTNAGDLDMASNFVYFGEHGVPMSNLTVTLSHANDRLFIYLV